MPFFLTTVIFTSQNTMLNTLAIAEKKTKISSYSLILGAILSIALNIIFIPHFGIIVPAISSIIAYMCMNIFLYKSISTKLDDFKFYYIDVSLFLLISYLCLNEISSIWLRSITIILYTSFYLSKLFHNKNLLNNFK